MRARGASAVLGALASAGACTRPAITGEVVDNTGRPLAAAAIVLTGSRSHTRSSVDGQFRLPCALGTYDLVVSQEGFHDTTRHVDVETRADHSAGTFTLTPSIPGDWVWALIGATPTALSPGSLIRRADPAHKTFCLVNDDSPALSTTSPFTLMTRAAAPWTLLRLDAEGCAQHMTWHLGRWREDQRDAPVPQTQTLGEEKRHVFTLPAGEYVIADWPDGRFRADAEASSRSGERRFVGARLTITGDDGH